MKSPVQKHPLKSEKGKQARACVCWAEAGGVAFGPLSWLLTSVYSLGN